MHPARQVTGAEQGDAQRGRASRRRLDINSALRLEIRCRLLRFSGRIAQQNGQAVDHRIHNGFVCARRVFEREFMSYQGPDLDASH